MRRGLTKSIPFMEFPNPPGNDTFPLVQHDPHTEAIISDPEPGLLRYDTEEEGKMKEIANRVSGTLKIKDLEF